MMTAQTCLIEHALDTGERFAFCFKCFEVDLRLLSRTSGLALKCKQCITALLEMVVGSLALQDRIMERQFALDLKRLNVRQGGLDEIPQGLQLLLCVRELLLPADGAFPVVVQRVKLMPLGIQLCEQRVMSRDPPALALSVE
jgi:hypothetical protein